MCIAVSVRWQQLQANHLSEGRAQGSNHSIFCCDRSMSWVHSTSRQLRMSVF